MLGSAAREQCEEFIGDRISPSPYLVGKSGFLFSGLFYHMHSFPIILAGKPAIISADGSDDAILVANSFLCGFVGIYGNSWEGNQPVRLASRDMANDSCDGRHYVSTSILDGTREAAATLDRS
jgi:hypothetical protein